MNQSIADSHIPPIETRQLENGVPRLILIRSRENLAQLRTGPSENTRCYLQFKSSRMAQAPLGPARRAGVQFFWRGTP